MACEVTSYERANEDVFIVNLTAYNGWCEDDINSIDPNRFQMLETTCSFLMLMTCCCDDELDIKPKLDFLLKNDTIRHVEYLDEYDMYNVSTDYSTEWRQAMLQTCQHNRAFYTMKATILCSDRFGEFGLAIGSYMWRHIFYEHIIPFFSLDLEN